MRLLDPGIEMRLVEAVLSVIINTLQHILCCPKSIIFMILDVVCAKIIKLREPRRASSNQHQPHTLTTNHSNRPISPFHPPFLSTSPTPQIPQLCLPPQQKHYRWSHETSPSHLLSFSPQQITMDGKQKAQGNGSSGYY